MSYILYDDHNRDNLLPLTFTRPVAEIRVGILSIREKWNKYLETICTCLTQDYLSEKYPVNKSDDNILINGSILPNEELVKKIMQLKFNQALLQNETVVAVRMSHSQISDNSFFDPKNFEKVTTDIQFNQICYPWHIFQLNGDEIQADFHLLTNGRKSEKISDTNNIIAADNVFLEAGAKMEYATINASEGPVYVGKDAEIMENSVIRGPFAINEHSVVKMGAKIYGPTTLGPWCKVGGEINNSVIFGYSNKAHDGFLGNAVIGEWCNLGADTNNSNLKNNYAEVRMWNYTEEKFIKTGLQFCGLVMGDHSKTAINSMLNTGTVVGVSSNLFGSDFPRNFVPSFSWGSTHGFSIYKLDKAFEVAERVMSRRNFDLNEIEKKILHNVFEQTEKHRKFK